MDKCLKIVLCLSFLLFSEQRPTTSKPKSVRCKSLNLDKLKKEVTCQSNLTFASLEFQEGCMAAAQQTFEAGLESAIKMNCTNGTGRLNDTLTALRRCKIQNQVNTVDCTSGQKTFPEFVDALKKFIEFKATINK